LKKNLYLLLLSFTVFSQNNPELEKLKTELKIAKTELEKTKAYSRLGYYYSDIDQKLSKYNLMLALDLAQKNKFDHELCYIYNNLGICYRFDNKLDSTKYYFEKAIALGEKTKDDQFLVTGYVSIGWYYKVDSKLPLALKYFNKGLEKAQSTNNKNSEADAYRKIADIHLNLNENKIAFEKYRKAGEIYLSVKNMSSYAEVLGGMGYAYRHTNNTDSAIHYLNKCIFILKSIKNYTLVPVAYTEIGKAYYEIKQYQKAETNFLQAIKEHERSQNYGHDDGLYIYLGQTQLELKKYEEAKKNIEIGQKYANKSGDLEMQVEASSALYNYYEKIGDFKNAYIQRNIYESQRDSINSNADLLATNEMIKKYDFEKQQRTIEKAEFDKKKKNYAIGFISLLLLALVLLGLSYFKRYKIHQQTKLQTAIFNQQTLATQAVLDGEERERKRIAADLHDGVGQTIMALKMNLLGINDHIEFKNPKAKEIFEKAVDLANESAKEVRTISHQMMPNALIKSGLASAIREFLQNIDLQNLKINLEVNNLSEPLEPTTEKVLYRVIQELVNNVIKHAKANILNISIDKNDAFILAKIEDNGQGFNSEKPDFEGIGLKNIKDRISFLKGDIKIESRKNLGTKVLISIPIS
jgi:two-component system, NarL family, sensor kinase